MTAADSIVASALFGMPASDFLREFYLRLPHLQRLGCEGISSLGDEMVLEHLYSHSTADSIATKNGSCSEEKNFRQLRSDGFTIGVRHAQLHYQPLADLAGRFEKVFLAPVDVHLYFTPGGTPGFNWHYDAEEVFILQTVGRKTWWLKKNSVYPWPLLDSIPKDQRFEREVMPTTQYELTAGDWLYVPSGYWHRTMAITDSCSLSVGVRAATAIDIYDALRPRLVQSILWRQRLPHPSAGENKEELLDAYHTILNQLSDDLQQSLRNKQLVQSVIDNSFHVKNDGRARDPRP